MPKLRLALESDVKELSGLICSSFLELASADWNSQAIEKLLADSSPEAIITALRGGYFANVAIDNNQIVGMVLFSKPNIMRMLFVSPKMIRKGIGRILWEAAREAIERADPPISTVELNSTTFAIPFYESVGFVSVSKIFEIEGVRMTRMVCWLRARSLNAEIDKAEEKLL